MLEHGPSPNGVLFYLRYREEKEGAKMKISELAKIYFAAEHAYLEATGNPRLLDWDHMPQWWQDEVVKTVTRLLAFVRACPVKDDITFVAYEAHKEWKTDLEAKGWVLGNGRNRGDKVEPLLMDFYDLPRNEQYRQYMLTAIVDSLRNYVEE